MFKLGVWRREQFFASPPDKWWLYLYYRLSRSRVSLRLLRDLRQESLDVDFFERLMKHVRLSNGVARTTFERRFQNLDLIVNPILSQYFSSRDSLRIEDWAASACLASCQWAENLFRMFPRMRFAASDLELSLIEVGNPASREFFIVEDSGRPLQYVCPPFVIRLEPPEPWPLVVNRIGYYWARFRWRRVRLLWPLSATWLSDAQDQEMRRGNYRLRKLPLVHPRALTLTRNDMRFTIRHHSVFERAESPCDVIRTMNILNRAYFSEQELSRAVDSVIASLRTGGIWIVGRTIQDEPPVHNVSIFRKQESGEIELIQHIGAGSEIDSMILEARPAMRGLGAFA